MRDYRGDYGEKRSFGLTFWFPGTCSMRDVSLVYEKTNLNVNQWAISYE